MHFSGFFCCYSVSHCSNEPTKRSLTDILKTNVLSVIKKKSFFFFFASVASILRSFDKSEPLYKRMSKYRMVSDELIHFVSQHNRSFHTEFMEIGGLLLNMWLQSGAPAGFLPRVRTVFFFFFFLGGVGGMVCNGKVIIFHFVFL